MSLYLFLLVMDIEFVELEYRQDIKNLMDICGVDLQTAYNLYHRHNCNLQAAVSEKLGLVSPQRLSPQRNHPLMMGSDIMAMSFDEEADPEFHRFSRFVENGIPFFKKYPIKTEINLEKKNGRQELCENYSFGRDLEVLLGHKSSLRVEGGKVEEGLRWSWKEKFPIAVLILDCEEESQQLKAILSSDGFVNELSTYFKIYGFNPNSSKLQPWLTKFISIPEDCNSLLIFRVNFVDQIETVGKIPLAGSIEDIRTRLQRVKSQVIQRELDEAHIIKQHALIRKGKTYQRPKPIKERIKVREDARLRRHQDEEFMKACLPKEKDQKQPLMQTSEKKPKISEKQLREIREAKRQKLPVFNEGLPLKLRMPSGKSFQILASADALVQYLFDYVESCPQDIGFEKDYQRSFDIVYGPEKDKCLGEVRSYKIGELLEQWELLIIKQTDQ